MKLAMFITMLAAALISLSANADDVRFITTSSSDVIDLSSIIIGKQHKRKPVVIEKFDNRTGGIGLILADQSRRYGDPDIVTPLAGEEKTHILKNQEFVSREGDTLSIRTSDGKVVKFRDWSVNGTQNSDGDGVSYRYSGMIPNSRFHQVDINAEHDVPSTYLVNAESGKIVGLFTGADVVSVSEDAQKLFVMSDGLNPPFGFFVSSLPSNGHGIELECYGSGGREDKFIPSFKGWHIKPYIGLDLVLLIRLSDQISYEAVPVSIMQKQGQWHVAVPNPQRFIQLTKLACWQ
jgi:hypothetical protein